MRRCYLVCYDIADPKRLQRVHKVMAGYGRRWQFSVFFCLLKEVALARLRADLEQEMNRKLDQVLIIDLGPDEKAVRSGLSVLGRSLPEMESGLLVI
jgi:CRISPR-associated protein Cas2